MIKLSKRLELISSLVSNRRIADIGCDHGLVVANLFVNNKIDFAIVSDISKMSAEKASSLLKNLNIQNFQMRVGDGLSTICKDDCIEEVVISGMGGNEIKQILSNTKLQFKRYILGAQHGELELKEFLINDNFNIIKDIILFDKKFYNILICEKGLSKNKKRNLYIPQESDVENLTKYIEYRLEKISKILEKTKNESLQEEFEVLQNYKSQNKRN